MYFKTNQMSKWVHVLEAELLTLLTENKVHTNIGVCVCVAGVIRTLWE